MAGSKYGDLIKYNQLIRDIPYYGGKSIVAHDGELDVDCSLGYHCITGKMSFPRRHAHDFPELLCFIGSDPLHMYDLGAEVEVTLGEEGEKHIIDRGAVVSIPSGLMHCPIVFTRVDRPLIFLEISLTRIWKPDNLPPDEER